MGLRAASVTSSPLYVCVYVPEFPAQARLRLRPEHHQAPVVVLQGEPPLQVVCSANRKALKLGVTHGMTRSELDSFVGITILRRSPEEEEAAQKALLTMAIAFTPRMQISSPRHAGAAVFALVLDLTGSTRMFGPAEQVAHTIAQATKGLCLTARFAVSENYQAAVCASAFAAGSPLHLPAGQERRSLSALPLAALGPTAEQHATFELWGLRSVGDLACLPEVELVSRLGQEGRRLQQLARGEHPHLLVPEEPAFLLEESLAFEAPEERLDSLLFVLGPMFDQLILRAQAHALALASVTIRLTLDGGGTHTRTLKPALPVADRFVLLRLLHLDLEARPPSAGVIFLHLHAEPGKQSKVQTSLFSPPLPEAMRLDVTLARLASVVGEDRVGRARLLDTHKPDTFVMERFRIPSAQPDKTPPAASLALRRLRPSVPLTMRLKCRQPASFEFEGKQYTIAAAYGPWRLSGAWWSDEVWAREEWDVHATTSGSDPLLGVVVQDLLQSTWSLEALYD